uniref:Ig-like domain-containing protein n=1 Tax=Gadus morhua TaxID=8049 RepID=A0A8C5A088_GADMO
MFDVPLDGPKHTFVIPSPPGEIMEGGSVTLSCSSDANPAADYTWFKDNQPLPWEPRRPYTLDPVSSKDRGTYRCHAENQYGYLGSNSVFIDVLCKWKTIIIVASLHTNTQIEELKLQRKSVKSKNISIQRRTPAYMLLVSLTKVTCIFVFSSLKSLPWPSPQVANKSLNLLNKQLVTHKPNYTISNITTELGGNYYCEARNAVGLQNSTLMFLNVTGYVLKLYSRYV